MSFMDAPINAQSRGRINGQIAGGGPTRGIALHRCGSFHSRRMTTKWISGLCAAMALGVGDSRAAEPFLNGELIFPPEHWHVHASCIVEAPNSDLIVCWFHGSGERKADDVKIEGARKRKGEDK